MSKPFSFFFDLHTPLGILIYAIVIGFASWGLSRAVRFVIIKIIKYKESKRYGKTSIQFFRNSINFLFACLALIILVFTVPVFRNKAGFIFSGAGILAAIIGFAAQAALSNLIAGAFIVIFKPFRVGDYIKLDDYRMGIVEDITLRHTVINNFENKRLIIPNSVISTDSILNHSIQDSHVLSFNNFKVGLKGDIDLARKIIQEEAIKLENVIATNKYNTDNAFSSTIEVRVIDIDETYIHLRAYVWMNNPFQEFKTKCYLKEAVHKRFVEEGVDLPIPITKIIRMM